MRSLAGQAAAGDAEEPEAQPRSLRSITSRRRPPDQDSQAPATALTRHELTVLPAEHGSVAISLSAPAQLELRQTAGGTSARLTFQNASAGLHEAVVLEVQLARPEAPSLTRPALTPFEPISPPAQGAMEAKARGRGRIVLGAYGWRLIALSLLTVILWSFGGPRRPEPAPPPVVEQSAEMDTEHSEAEVVPPIDHLPVAPPVLPSVAETRLDPTPVPATPTPPVVRRVANTGGIGLYLRSEPRRAARLWAWPDGTVLRPTGVETEAEGLIWVQVYDPTQTLGWVPAQYLAE